MSVIDAVAELMDEASIRDQRTVAIEIGERQARDLAAELNASIPVFDPVLMARCGIEPMRPKRVGWREVISGEARLFDIPIRGVESPDYLRVVAVSRKDLA